ncbi:NADP-dependent malic enzyme [Neorhizobium sp. S3-V5DH]|uniref:NADP-dependent malic enzyme n=1 Tax=Neorhizobium sp. S3-V5DH TaxID=2485166 RepID=UPI0010537D76|nr:NADP-dependent malic enzyme [Neorhizobium sp. S3-V5DH]TCV67427.1 malate dehydrogenase (oxaloacetate-decarboxylating)(NADP+) [Neorhizobium sp. S3-V5DH]
MIDDVRQAALDYHRHPEPGKLGIQTTKRMETQRDLALAYSPGVAAPCEAIVADPANARQYTARGNLVGVITNGTAVLGLGNIGPLAAKPVMEGKAVLFKKFAGIDSFDIEVDTTDVEAFCDAVALLEPTFGGINLEDIKAPECFLIEANLRSRMKIPVFHDDQHGTAIVCAAAVTNALRIQGKRIEEVRLVTSGAGAAAIACVELLAAMGMKHENITLTDIDGVVHAERNTPMLPNMRRFAHRTDARKLADVVAGADIFLGLSAPGVFQPEWLPLLAPHPLILAMANPDPEILPHLVKAARPDAIIATGRSDFPNQVNNLLCFPYIFRGALDCQATEINEAMKMAAVSAIAALARAEPDEAVANAYGGEALLFGPEHIIPKPFDPRLILEVAPAVAKAAAETDVALSPIADLAAYRRQLERHAFNSTQLMMPVFEAARRAPKRVAYAAGETEPVLRAAQIVVDERLARPVLVGRAPVIEDAIARLGLRIRVGDHIEVFDPTVETDVLVMLQERYVNLVERRGVTPQAARRRLRQQPTVVAAMLLEAGLVDAALCGTPADWSQETRLALEIIPKAPGVGRVSALTALIHSQGTLFFADTHLNVDPNAEQIAELTLMAAEQVRRFGQTPTVALTSHSNFGVSKSPSARKMRDALAILRSTAPDLDVDGEMHADAAINPAIRARAISKSTLDGAANLLVMPSLDAANISLTLLTSVTKGVAVGPLLLGMSKPLHVLVPSTTTRGIVNMTALVVTESVSNWKGD